MASDSKDTKADESMGCNLDPAKAKESESPAYTDASLKLTTVSFVMSESQDFRMFTIDPPTGKSFAPGFKHTTASYYANFTGDMEGWASFNNVMFALSTILPADSRTITGCDEDKDEDKAAEKAEGDCSGNVGRCDWGKTNDRNSLLPSPHPQLSTSLSIRLARRCQAKLTRSGPGAPHGQDLRPRGLNPHRPVGSLRGRHAQDQLGPVRRDRNRRPQRDQGRRELHLRGEARHPSARQDQGSVRLSPRVCAVLSDAPANVKSGT